MLISRRNLLRSGAALSAATLLPSYLPAFADPGATPPRERLLFDFGWKFIMGNGNEPARDQLFGYTQEEFARAGNFKMSFVKYDDKSWRTLDLPHDWAIELPFVNDIKLKDHGYKPIGRRYPQNSVGWYRRKFMMPAEDRGRSISIEFDGVFRDVLVFVNGYFIGRHNNGYASFAFDLSDYLNYGAENAIALRVDASYGDGWFYEGAGVYRHVWLVKQDRLHLGRWESFVRASVQGEGASLQLGTELRNETDHAETGRVRWTIRDAEGHQVALMVSAPQTLQPGEHADSRCTVALKQATLWDTDNPYLYTATAELIVGQPHSAVTVRDAETLTFGVRSVRFDADHGFFLNGKPLKIKGTCNHQDHAGVGVALADDLQDYRLQKLREMNSNAVRTSHNMPAPEWVRACDRLGMMMMCETRTMGSNADALLELETMVKRYRNSPSIIIWSMGNEEPQLQRNEQGEHVVKTMVDLCHRLDPTRLCTAAVNGAFGNGVSKSIDVEGFNYNLDKIAPYHSTHPKHPLIGSETAHHTVATRGVHFTDESKNEVGASDLDTKYVFEQPDLWWTQYATNDYLPGGFIWTGFDYRGEPTPYTWPSISSQFGVLDTCGFPKDKYFYYKAWWGKEPVVHVFPHWNWPDRLGQKIPVWVHTNLPEAELFLNGKSFGKQSCKQYGHLIWEVPYEHGVIEARGLRAGQVVVSDRRETTGPVASLKIVAEKTPHTADGESLIILAVQALDAQGTVVPTANLPVRFTITGAARFLGVGNGDPNCLEPDNQPQRSLFNGLAQLLLRAGKTPGEVQVIAESQTAGIQSARWTLTLSGSRLRPHVPLL